MKKATIFFGIIILVTSCLNQEISNQSSESTTTRYAKFSSNEEYELLTINNLNEYFYKPEYYTDEGITFKVLHKNDVLKFRDFLLSEKEYKDEISYRYEIIDGREVTDTILEWNYPSGNEMLDTIKTLVGNHRFRLELGYLPEGLGFYFSFVLNPPKTGQEYIKGITWMKVEEDYFSKLYENRWWWTGFDIYWDFGNLDLLDWEKELIQRENLDSLGLMIAHIHPYDSIKDQSELNKLPPNVPRNQYDSLYFFREYPDKMLPVHSVWKPINDIQIITDWHGISRYSNSDRNLGVSSLIYFLQNYDYEREYTFEEFKWEFEEFLAADNFSELVIASPFHMRFSAQDLKVLDELISLDESYRNSHNKPSSYFEEWKRLKYLREDAKFARKCPITGKGFHMDNTMAIKFNDDGRFNSSDRLMNISKSFWGTWEQKGNKIITTCDGSTTGMGIGQQNTYTYDCDKLTIGGFTLVKD